MLIARLHCYLELVYICVQLCSRYELYTALNLKAWAFLFTFGRHLLQKVTSWQNTVDTALNTKPTNQCKFFNFVIFDRTSEPISIKLGIVGWRGLKLQRFYSKNKNEVFPDNGLTYKRQSAMLLHYNPMFTENTKPECLQFELCLYLFLS